MRIHIPASSSYLLFHTWSIRFWSMNDKKFYDKIFNILVYLGQLPEELLVPVLSNKYTEKLCYLTIKVGNSWTKHKIAKGLFYRMVQNVPLMKNFDQKVLSLKLTWTLISLHFVLIMPACKCLSDWNGWSIRCKWHARDRRGTLKLLVKKENFLSHDHTDKPRERKAHHTDEALVGLK